MIALFNFVPHYCPNCGHEIKFIGYESKAEYLANVSHYCRTCDLHYSHVDTERLIEASKQAGSDLAQYVSE